MTDKNWKALHALAEARRQHGVKGADIARELEVSPQAISAWGKKHETGAQLRDRAGRPPVDDETIANIKRVLLIALDAVPNPDLPGVPLIPPISYPKVKGRLEQLRIFQSEKWPKYWIKKFGWDNCIVPKSYVDEYQSYIAELGDFEIELIAQKLLQINAIFFRPYGGDTSLEGFELNPCFSLESFDQELDQAIIRQEFSGITVLETLRANSSISAEEIRAKRADLVSHAKHDAVIVIAGPGRCYEEEPEPVDPYKDEPAWFSLS